MTVKRGRNEACHCGSGKKLKHCCGQDTRASRPDLSSTQVSRLASLVREGRHSDLEVLARQLLGDHPDSGLLWKLLGLSLWSQSKDPLSAVERAAALLPDDAEAHVNLGNARRAAGQLAQAAASHRRALKINPDYAEAHNNLGSVLQDQGYLDEAAASFRRAIAIRPDFALAHSNLGNVLTLQNHTAEAETACQRALELNPRLTAPIVQLAELYADHGRFADAENLLRRALAIEPDMPEAWAGLVRWRKMAHGDAWLGEALRIVRQRLPPRREAHLRFALGKYFDDLGDFEQAFVNYRRANELTRLCSPKYDRGAMTRIVDHIIRRYDGEWLRRAAADASDSERPVFIVGMWRSGSTLVEQILASHPSVFGAGEISFWNPASMSCEAAVAQGAATNPLIQGLARDYLTGLAQRSGDALRVVDKMSSNFLHLGLIHAALPKARIIHLHRNPIDNCLSIYFQNFQNAHFFANDLEDLAHYYTEYRRVMEHWRSLLPPQALLELSYEQLVAEPEQSSRAMVGFIGLPWDARCMEFAANARAVSTFSKWQVRQGISKSSVERWRNYEKFLAPLFGLEGRAPTAPVAAAL